MEKVFALYPLVISAFSLWSSLVVFASIMMFCYVLPSFLMPVSNRYLLLFCPSSSDYVGVRFLHFSSLLFMASLLLMVSLLWERLNSIFFFLLHYYYYYYYYFSLYSWYQLV